MTTRDMIKIPQLTNQEYDEIKKRFLSKVKKTKTCWLWTAYKDKYGYGQFGIKGKVYRVHRISYWIKHNCLPYGQLICHHCDNPSCVNPDHLFCGNDKDNSQDRINKGRGINDVAHLGEENGQSKITKDDVIKIRKLHKNGLTYKLISKKFPIGTTQIHRIITKNKWRHI